MSLPNIRTTEHGQTILAEARQAYTSGLFASDASPEAGEENLRLSLAKFWSAMNWLEGTADFEVAHSELHRAGRATRDRFPGGCEVAENDDGSFVERCPVPLSHERYGLSIGSLGNAICSICWGDASECPHLPGRIYDVPAEHHDRYCNICGKPDCREHVEGSTYAAEIVVIVTEAEAREVSLVADPAMPDARIHGLPVSRETLEERFGHRLPDSVVVPCDNCLAGCTGFTYVDSVRPAFEA